MKIFFNFKNLINYSYVNSAIKTLYSITKFSNERTIPTNIRLFFVLFFICMNDAGKVNDTLNSVRTPNFSVSVSGEHIKLKRSSFFLMITTLRLNIKVIISFEII